MPVPDRPLRSFLARLHAAVQSRRVRVTRKTEQELEELGWEVEDVLVSLGDLAERDFLRREPARVATHDLVWVFCPSYWDGVLWIRLVEQADAFVLVVSFHPAEGDPWTR